MRKELRCITGKKSYKSKKDAHAALNRISQESNRDTIPIRVYACPISKHSGGCSGWHLTHREKTEYKERELPSFEVTPESIANRINKLKKRMQIKHEEKGFYEPMTEDDKRLILYRYNTEDISYLELAREIAKDPEEVRQLITEHFIFSHSTDI